MKISLLLLSIILIFACVQAAPIFDFFKTAVDETAKSIKGKKYFLFHFLTLNIFLFSWCRFTFKRYGIIDSLEN
jgi:hypothetical protein